MPKFITKETFKCDRYCGECCKKAFVPLQPEDIARIKELGYEESDFVMRDPHLVHRKMLKQGEDGCIFLKKSKAGRYTCGVHSHRPYPCREYPFIVDKPIESCLPDKLFPNVFFKTKK